MKKQKQRPFYQFNEDGFSFTSSQAARNRLVYAPLCGPSADKIKSSITPFLSGDIKIDKDHYLTKPCSREDLRQRVRNFYVRVNNKIVSLDDPVPKGEARIDVGFLWHKLNKRFKGAGIELEAVNFIPASGENAELMRVEVRNISKKTVNISPYGAVSIFGRGLENKHDHEHVTALLHRIKQLKEGVVVEPTMRFDEKGHHAGKARYFVFGASGEGKPPTGSYPTLESFLNEASTMDVPWALVNKIAPQRLNKEELNGKEAMGALKFADRKLRPGQSCSFILILGIAFSGPTPLNIYKRFNSTRKFKKALVMTKEFWQEKCHAIEFFTGDGTFNRWLKWVTIQPVLRRIFGCSFLPDHDYGKGGKGWRDIWQDLLSLILIEPEHVRDILINNFAGVRIDGSNATIVGSVPGEFIADRNRITRVWMDHGVWPLLTLELYMDQTGDEGVLLKKQSYFRDTQLSRTFRKDNDWSEKYGRKLKDKNGKVYRGTILEHLLVQHLVQFFNVGKHNITRLESADWNDGLDMAFEKGESVAFMCLYGANLKLLAQRLNHLSEKKGIKEIEIAKELKLLLDTLGKKLNYNSPGAKRKRLFEGYFKAVEPQISGKKVNVSLKKVVADLEKKSTWIFEHINKQEKVRVGPDRWFNGYYDNKGKRVEGRRNNRMRMTLTGQVFPIMSGVAQDQDVKNIIKSVNKYLKDKKLGGIRLNTDFGLTHYLDLGRAFGFAFGTKENGAFFSHMTVMYAYALYKRGFAKEGRRVLRSIYTMSQDGQRAKIYPGVPEYFDNQGQGMYHYLTGSASWFVLTQLTQVFGVRGFCGDLLLAPKLMKEDFDQQKEAKVFCHFAGTMLNVTYHNPGGLDYGRYRIKEVFIDTKKVECTRTDEGCLIDRKLLDKGRSSAQITVQLGL